MAREILLSKKTEQGLRLDPRTKLLLIFIISIFVMGGTGGEAMGLIRLVLCTVPAILLLTSKQCAKAVGYIAVFSAFYAVQIYVFGLYPDQPALHGHYVLCWNEAHGSLLSVCTENEQHDH